MSTQTRRVFLRVGFAGLIVSLPGTLFAAGVPASSGWLEEVVVVGQLDHLRGDPVSASEGMVPRQQLELRPVLRLGELLEVVPGLVVTQRSGDGKANQFFLRGFNLDHGTDLATSVDGVPVNMPTHGHSQGYTDINFVIPELVRSIEYRKGTYYADTGDFSAAGAVDLRYRSKLDAPLLVLESGEDRYMRGLLAGSTEVKGGSLLFGVDYSRTNGPWNLPEDFNKSIALVRYTHMTDGGQVAVTAGAYRGAWLATNQIPQRAVDAGLDRFAAIDPNDGGESHRYSLSAEWNTLLGSGRSRTQVYAVDYRLDLFSNYTYNLDVVHGDQFEQLDDRKIYGARWSWIRPALVAGREQDFLLGVDVRQDDIGAVGHYRTLNRVRFDTVSEDSVEQTSLGAYAGVSTHWTPQIRTNLGLRLDRFHYDVDALTGPNSGTAQGFEVSPKFALIVSPWRDTEFFANVGKGFHSNDARSATRSMNRGEQQTPAVDPLVDALGADVGVRTSMLPDIQLTASVWMLNIESELLFVGDVGTTEPNRESQRRGVEVAAIWTPRSWFIADADLAWSRARYSDPLKQDVHIPGAIERVASLGFAVDHPTGWFGGARFRHFGSSPLNEHNGMRSDPTTLVNIEAGYRFTDRYKLSLAMFNVLNSADNDITYLYKSQLPGELQPVEDVHFHPVEPRTVRMTLTASF